MACRLATDMLTHTGKTAIEAGLELCRTAVKAGDIPAYAAANLTFHSSIHRASANAYLLAQLDHSQARINVYRLMPYEVVGRLEQSLEEHYEISRAIFAKDGQRADSLMREHMMLQGARLPSLLKALA